jgi:hypothetical protein
MFEFAPKSETSNEFSWCFLYQLSDIINLGIIFVAFDSKKAE